MLPICFDDDASPSPLDTAAGARSLNGSQLDVADDESVRSSSPGSRAPRGVSPRNELASEGTFGATLGSQSPQRAVGHSRQPLAVDQRWLLTPLGGGEGSAASPDGGSDTPSSGGGGGGGAARWVLEHAGRRGSLLEMQLDLRPAVLRLVPEASSSSFCELSVA